MPGFKKILVAVDFSEQSRLAMRFAHEFAQKLEGDIILILYVLKNPSGIYALSSPVMFNLEAKEVEEARKRLIEFVNSLNIRLDADRFRVTIGYPAETIVNEAKAISAELIIVGSRGKGLNFAVGSTAAKVIRHASCPVVTIKEPVA